MLSADLLTPLERTIAAGLYQALGQKIGLILRTNDPQRLRPLIYRTRILISDPLLDQIQVRSSTTNPSSELLLFRMAEPKTSPPSES